MAIAIDELDLAFLVPTDAPLWQPLKSDEPPRLDGRSLLTMATSGAPSDSGWNAVARELEQDLVWAEVVALLEVSEATKLLPG